MRITCPACGTSYTLSGGALGVTGRTVRCARCGNTWHARIQDVANLDETAAEAEWAAVEPEAITAMTDEVSEGGVPLDVHRRSATAAPDRPPSGREPGTALATVEATDAAGATEPLRVPPTIEAELPGFDALRARRRRPVRYAAAARRPVASRVLPALVVGIAAVSVVALVAGGLFAREWMVRRVPDLAGLYALAGMEVNLRGLAFEDLATYRDADGSAAVLVVNGAIRNVSAGERPVPNLRFALHSAAGREVYAWTMEPVDRRLDPGETLRFTSRLPAPPEAAADVAVRFTDRQGP